MKHTANKPYCDDTSCSCHTNLRYHDRVQHPEKRKQTDEDLSWFMNAVLDGETVGTYDPDFISYNLYQ